MDSMGRRGSILLWTAIFVISVAIQTVINYSIAQITIGRLIAGLGVGALSGLYPFLISNISPQRPLKAIVPLYIGETAPKSIRGMMLVLYQLQIIIGIFLSYIVDLGTHTHHRQLGILAYSRWFADVVGSRSAFGCFFFPARITVGCSSPSPVLTHLMLMIYDG